MRGAALHAARRAAATGPRHRPPPRGWDAWSARTSEPAAGRHPLADRTVSQALHRRADEIEAAFGAIA
ncbi:MAG: carboxysome shell protein, partial [Bradyrhizobium sp.]|nr:carboxysome shell protein [Bradyrhizobium sp.]